MNERIQELYQQAHSIRHHDDDPMRDGNPPTVYWQGEKSAEKFAELIVKECARIVTDAVDQREAASTYADRIKQHFGVEE